MVSRPDVPYLVDRHREQRTCREAKMNIYVLNQVFTNHYLVGIMRSSYAGTGYREEIFLAKQDVGYFGPFWHSLF
jgi:hypothetical protein